MNIHALFRAKKNIDEQPSRALIGSPEQVFQENLKFSSKGLLIQ
jgi:hypothetical protein